MAGSQREQSKLSFSDPILKARVEAIKQLAGGLTDRVAVMDRHFNVIYANESAWSSASVRDSEDHQAKCYEAFAHQTDPCGACREFFDGPRGQAAQDPCAGGGNG